MIEPLSQIVRALSFSLGLTWQIAWAPILAIT